MPRLVLAFPAARRDGFELGAALRRFLKVAPQKPDGAGVRGGAVFFSKCSIEFGPGPFKSPVHPSASEASWTAGPIPAARCSLAHTQYLSQGPRHRT